MNDQTVLVTGGTGFLAAWCIAQLLTAGYLVRATVRSPGKEDQVRHAVAAAGAAQDDAGAAAGADPGDAGTAAGAAQDAAGAAAGAAAEDALSFAVADLTADDGWAEAAAGCSHVLHVASPFPPGAPKDESEVIVPAVEGTLRVLRAARDAGAQRTVVTSSFAAIGYGHPQTDRAFTEQDWTDVTGPGVTPYIKSKALAERAAWDFAEHESGGMELSKARAVLDWEPRSAEDAVTATAQSLVSLGLLP